MLSLFLNRLADLPRLPASTAANTRALELWSAALSGEASPACSSGGAEGAVAARAGHEEVDGPVSLLAAVVAWVVAALWRVLEIAGALYLSFRYFTGTIPRAPWQLDRSTAWRCCTYRGRRPRRRLAPRLARPAHRAGPSCWLLFGFLFYTEPVLRLPLLAYHLYIISPAGRRAVGTSRVPWLLRKFPLYWGQSTYFKGSALVKTAGLDPQRRYVFAGAHAASAWGAQVPVARPPARPSPPPLPPPASPDRPPARPAGQRFLPGLLHQPAGLRAAVPRHPPLHWCARLHRGQWHTAARSGVAPAGSRLHA